MTKEQRQPGNTPRASRLSTLFMPPPITEQERLVEDAAARLVRAFQATRTSFMAYTAMLGISPGDAAPVLTRFASGLQDGLGAIDKVIALTRGCGKPELASKRHTLASAIETVVLLAVTESTLADSHLEKIDVAAKTALDAFHFLSTALGGSRTWSVNRVVRRRRNWLLAIMASLCILCTAAYVSTKPRLLYPLDYDRRVEDIRSLQRALEKFHRDSGIYPASSGFDGLHTKWGESRPDWVVGLAPKYIAVLPRDPRRNDDPANQYLYKSDGRDYKLIAHNPGDCERAKAENPAMVDPARDCFAYGVWTPGAKDW